MSFQQLPQLLSQPQKSQQHVCDQSQHSGQAQSLALSPVLIHVAAGRGLGDSCGRRGQQSRAETQESWSQGSPLWHWACVYLGREK